MAPRSVKNVKDGSGDRAADAHDIPIKLELQRSTGAIKDTRGAVFRTQCSWPTRYPVHSYYADGFPALRARTNIGADSLGLHHYRFGGPRRRSRRRRRRPRRGPHRWS